MRQERCVLPVKCKHCGAVFDLWYDLQVQEQLRNVSQRLATVSLSRQVGRLFDQQAYCWDCRKRLVGEQMEEDIELEGFDFSRKFDESY